jgi:glyoxylase-like metal-dependent hydrolase (beta-lactamase superfamily II)
MFEPRPVAPDTESLGAYFPLPGYGILPINAFVLRAAQPVLIDTGIAGLSEDFMGSLRATIDPQELRWIWLTHTDPDHLGSLRQVLEAAPEARVVTTYLGMGKMGLLQLPLDRVYLLNPGQRLDVGDRELLAVHPPCFDAPETTGLLDLKTHTLFSADCFGALMGAPAEAAVDIEPTELHDGLITWATIDAPWLQLVEERRFRDSLDDLRRLEPEVVLSAHLPPAPGMVGVLLEHLEAARAAPAFVGPDQAVLARMMAGPTAA